MKQTACCFLQVRSCDHHPWSALSSFHLWGKSYCRRLANPGWDSTTPSLWHNRYNHNHVCLRVLCSLCVLSHLTWALCAVVCLLHPTHPWHLIPQAKALYAPEFRAKFTEAIENHPGYKRSMLSSLRHMVYRARRVAFKNVGAHARPVAVCWGTEDDITPLGDAPELLELLPKAKLVTCPNTGHWVGCLLNLQPRAMPLTYFVLLMV